MGLGWVLSIVDPQSLEMDPLPVCLFKFFIGMIVMDTWQYWMHRTAHMNKTLYNMFHSWHHRLLCPYPIGALYNHPVEGFMLDSVGGFLSILISGMDIYTSIVWVSLSTFKTVCDHCNLDLPLNPFQTLFNNNARYHDFHHQSYGFKKNFSQP